MNHSASLSRANPAAAVRTTRSTPSPPTPRRRSHTAATNSGVSSSRPSGSGKITKSLPVPWPLLKRTNKAYGSGWSLPARAGRQHRPRAVGPLRTGEQKTMRPVALDFADRCAFGPRLDAFGDHQQAALVGQGDGCGNGAPHRSRRAVGKIGLGGRVGRRAIYLTGRLPAEGADRVTRELDD